MDNSAETFEQFKQSFWYGSRSDLAFKFLASLSDSDAAEFFRQLLELLGDVFDTGEYDRVRGLVYAWQVRAYHGDGHTKFSYDDGPFTPVDKPLEELTVALVSAGGVHLEHDDPGGGETQAEAEARISEYLRTEPELVEIPHDTLASQVRVRHPGYDVRGARRDPNAVFPIDILRQLEAEGVVQAAERHYGFVGACSQLALRKTIAPGWAERMAAAEVDACLLVATWPVCHVSVGHVARAFEAAGVSTVGVFIRAFRHVAEAMTLPRTLITPHLMGRTVGPPGDAERQRRVVEAALGLLVDARAAGVVVTLD